MFIILFKAEIMDSVGTLLDTSSSPWQIAVSLFDSCFPVLSVFVPPWPLPWLPPLPCPALACPVPAFHLPSPPLHPPLPSPVSAPSPPPWLFLVCARPCWSSQTRFARSLIRFVSRGTVSVDELWGAELITAVARGGPSGRNVVTGMATSLRHRACPSPPPPPRPVLPSSQRSAPPVLLSVPVPSPNESPLAPDKYN